MSMKGPELFQMLHHFLSALTISLFGLIFVTGTCQSSVTQQLTAQTIEGVIEETRTSYLDCQWLINAADYVELNISEWSLYNDELCSEDSLNVYDGHDTTALLLAKLCGRGTAKTIISTGRNLYISFKTGGGSSGNGFRLSYKSLGMGLPRCHPKTSEWPTRRYLRATNNEQIITSQYYPLDYPTNTREEWVIIKPTSTSSLAVVILDMDIEESHYCGYDYIAIFNGKCSLDKKKAKVCGSTKYSWTLTGSEHVLIRFNSDSGKTGRGFKLKFYLGTIEEPESDKSALHAVLIGLITICVVIIVLLASAKLYMHCFKKPKIRPNQTQLQNRRSMLETQVRRGPLGSRLARMMTAQSIHAEMRRYLGNSEQDSRVSTFEISSSQASGTGLVYEDGLFQPPSYSTLFRHSEDSYQIASAPPVQTELAPPPYPGSPDFKPEDENNGVRGSNVSPVNGHVKEESGTIDNQGIRPPPYQSN